MRSITLSIPPRAREFLASTIADAGGNEVFFLARVAWEGDEEALLEEVDVLARGHRSAAPAIIERAQDWDLALHNHPSGELSPSEADLAVAAELGNRGVGFAIIDNRADRLYLVVPPFREGGRKGPEPVDLAEVEAIFAGDGPLARALPDYEMRAGQVAMARQVAEALNSDRIVALEAGTGVGKSLAYLVPAILWAVRNRQRVVVSTNTINLQEQLVQKDLPLLERALPVKFRSALIKGRGNYACKRKLADLEREGARDLVETEDQTRQLQDLLTWARTAREGSLSELGVEPPEEVWERVMSETDKSLKASCRFYGECFYYQARRAAGRADIVVVNHHLFFADLALRRQSENYDWDLVIPGYRRVVFDEAHHLEDVASQHLGVRFSQLGLRSRFARLRSEKDPQRGALPHLARRLRKEGAVAAAEVLEKGLLQDLPQVAARVEEHFQAARGLVEEEARRRRAGEESEGSSETRDAEVKLRLTTVPGDEAFRRAMLERLGAVEEELSIILRQAERAISTLEAAAALTEDKREELLLELTSLRSRLAALCEGIEVYRDQGDRTLVRWVEARSGRRPDRRSLTFAAAPIRIGEELRSAVYEPLRTVVLTSATLSVEGNVRYFGERLGLDRVTPDRFTFNEHPSPFDYPRQALVLVPEDLPEPGAPGYEDRLIETVGEILKRSRGRAFVLFTAYGLLRRAHAALEGPLRAEGIRALRQGESPRSDLLGRFRSGPPHALFGTDSFWEGVDVKGEALSCVVITRLPFRVPSEPLQLARVEDLEARGENAFASFSVPQAVLKFKQGFGRLIRSATDRGAVVVLDRRLVTKSYGRAFLRSLPPARFARAPIARVLSMLEGFLGGKSLEPAEAGPAGTAGRRPAPGGGGRER